MEVLDDGADFVAMVRYDVVGVAGGGLETPCSATAVAACLLLSTGQASHRIHGLWSAAGFTTRSQCNVALALTTLHQSETT